MKAEYNLIATIIESNSTVLDVGCDDGTLMEFLKKNKNVNIRGIEISANHLRSVKNGFVFARANPIHIGKRTHIWEIQIKDKDDNLVSHCKLTTMILEKK